MKNLVFLLEEPSAREMLKGVVPRIISDGIDVEYIVFEGKRDMEKKFCRKNKYWQKPNFCFLIMIDQDGSECRKLQKKIFSSLQEIGKEEFSLVRIACRELESFYLGDLKSVEKALDLKGISANQNKAKFRSPDDVDTAIRNVKNVLHSSHFECLQPSEKHSFSKCLKQIPNVEVYIDFYIWNC